MKAIFLTDLNIEQYNNNSIYFILIFILIAFVIYKVKNSK